MEGERSASDARGIGAGAALACEARRRPGRASRRRSTLASAPCAARRRGPGVREPSVPAGSGRVGRAGGDPIFDFPDLCFDLFWSGFYFDFLFDVFWFSLKIVYL